MTGRLEGKVAVVTGAAGGIGLETCILMLQEGASVIMADVSQFRLEIACYKAKKLVPQASERIQLSICDVSDESSVAKTIAQTDQWGGLDVMFNNAGIMHAKDGEEVEQNIWGLTMEINVNGVWYGSKHAIKNMRQHGKKRGSIINTASVVSLAGAATPHLAYTASKDAVLALTRELAIVHAREGFRFNALCLAPINTPLLQDWLGDDKEKRARRKVHFPTGRFGETIKQAHAVVLLASDESSFVNATDFVLEGLTKACITPTGSPTEPPRTLAS